MARKTNQPPREGSLKGLKEAFEGPPPFPPRDAFWISGFPMPVCLAAMVTVSLDLAIVHFLSPRLSVETVYVLRGFLALSLFLSLVALRKLVPSDYGLTLTGWRGDLRLIFRMGLIVMGIWILLMGGLVLAFRLGWLPRERLLDFRDFRDGPEFLRFLLVSLLAAPLVEELIYRGLTFPALALAFGRRAAVLISGPFFYLLHLAYDQNKIWMFHYVIAGWILAWAYQRTGRLWVPILLHLLGNLLMGFDDLIVILFPSITDLLLDVC